MSTPGGFIWYEFMSPNPDATRAFYGTVCGWAIDEGSTVPEVDYRTISAADGLVGGVLGLTIEMIARGARPGWVGYLDVEDVDASVARAGELGATVHVPATDIPRVGRFALLGDPAGVPFYVMRPMGEGVSRAFDERAVGHVAWNELATTDQVGALAFFGALAGWESREAMPMGEMGSYALIDHAGRRIGAIMPRQPEVGPPGWTFYVRVDEIGAAVDRIVGADGTVLHGPVEVPGGEWIVVARDPHGATFGLVGPYENDVE